MTWNDDQRKLVQDEGEWLVSQYQPNTKPNKIGSAMLAALERIEELELEDALEVAWGDDPIVPELEEKIRSAQKRIEALEAQKGSIIKPNRLYASSSEVINFIEWLASQPCIGNSSGQMCYINAPYNPEWCCVSCQAALLRYGPPGAKKAQ
jgi:hypothetical protein